uniref:Molybdenum cofactor sulfurase n=1 Tax=Oryza punctata TaxID=4537 RepID=A0A0E0LEI6_ORYPU
MEMSKEEFLGQFGGDYGYPGAPKGVDEMRATEFKRLEGMAYLDHAGATLYSEVQMADVLNDLTSNVYGNPHSQSDSSMATSDLVTAARHQVLKYFNASPREYKCIFTSGATAALKLVGECFPWSRESCYMYTMENHNSVLGIREYALSKGATVLAVDVEEVADLAKNHGSDSLYKISRRSNQRRGKDVLSHNCQNGSLSDILGQKFSLSLVKLIKEGKIPLQQQGKWMVLIDAAKGCATEPPNLTVYPADFVVCSFYKIFGYPTGLGALIVKNEAANLLNKTYFSGGTIAASIADIDFVQKRKNIEQVLEDGTISFLNIASLRHGFKIIEMLTTSAIERHTASLATYVRNKMLDLKHSNEINVCTIYGQQSSKVEGLKMGPTITFNLKREDGSWFGYREVEKLASLFGIHLRTGCFCNPGACAKYLGLSHSDLVSNFEAGHVCWDDNDIINGKPTGAVRISFGYMSTYEDAEKFLKFLQSSFVSLPVQFNGYMLNLNSLNLIDNSSQKAVSDIHLKSIIIYPVKSCQGFGAKSWPLTTGGLMYDREWLLQGSGGEILTQKKVPELGSIRTLIDLELGKLFIESPTRRDKLQVSLLESLADLREEIDVFGQRYEVQSYGKGDCKQKLPVDAMRFRPNLVISGSSPYSEDNWKKLCIGEACFTSMGGCNRCQMINLHQDSGQVLKSKEPLATLASYRRKKGKILFGILLNYEDIMEGENEIVAERWLQVGQQVHPSIE